MYIYLHSPLNILNKKQQDPISVKSHTGNFFLPFLKDATYKEHNKYHE